jgi:hypothetical protein
MSFSRASDASALSSAGAPSGFVITLTTPLNASPQPLGSMTGTHSLPNASRIELMSSTYLMLSWSILLMERTRATPAFVARSHILRVLTRIPSAALMQITAVSTALMPQTASPTKSGYPGASRMLISRPCTFTEATARSMEFLRSFSSGSKSRTVVPSSTAPMRLVAFVLNSMASASVVLPDEL